MQNGLELLLSCSCLPGSLALFRALVLDYNKEVVLIRRNHHIVFLAGHTQEGQVILRVQIAH